VTRYRDGREVKEPRDSMGSVWGFLTHPTVWRWCKGLYSILGWIFTSLTVLTIAGVFKRLAERD
jgi:hypothetical protein